MIARVWHPQSSLTRMWRWAQTATGTLSRSHDAGLRRVGTRLALQTVGLVLVMLIVLELVAYLITQQAILGSLHSTLEQRANPAAAYVQHIFHLDGNSGPGGPLGGPGPGPGGGGPGPGHGPGFPNPDLTPSDASTVYVDPRYQVVHYDGTLKNRILDQQSLRQALLTGQTECCSVKPYQGHDYLVYSNPLRVGGKLVGAVQASISESQYEVAMQLLRTTLLVVALLGLFGAGGVSILLVQRALRPIRVAVQRQRDFVADAAHELRTPLAIQRTVAEVSLTDGSTENYEATVEQMLVENKHLTRLVDDLSLLARADSHAVTITPAPMNLSSLVAGTTNEIEPLAEDQGVHLTADVGANVWVQGDIMRLRQLLLILLDNALKHTPADGSVHVRLHTVAGRAQLQVRDTGPGIEPADLSRIFDRFYRIDKARTGEGSGLGLAIARWVVEAHGGHIQAGNVSPHGAIFTAVVPLTRVEGAS